MSLTSSETRPKSTIKLDGIRLKIKQIITIIGVLILASFAFTGTAQAAPTVENVAENQQSTKSPTGLTPEFSGEVPDDFGDPVREKLESLVGEQTQAEIESVLSSGQPSNVLHDPISGLDIAAILVEDTVSTQRLTSLPGCTSAGACIYEQNLIAGNRQSGWGGTGSVNINISFVSRVSSGDRISYFWYPNGNAVTLLSNQTRYFTTFVSLARLSRSCTYNC